MPRLVRPARKRAPRKPRVRRFNRRKPIYKRRGQMNSMTDRAKVVEVENYNTIQSGVGQNLIWKLNQFPRALAVSKNYRYYRCTRVEIEFIPYANVFAPGTSFPELYYQTDLTASIPTPQPTENSMLSRGVLPVKWTSVVKRSFSPAVLRYENLEVQKTSDVIDVQPMTSTPVKYKWYMTQQAYSASLAMATTIVGPALDPTNLNYHGCAFIPMSLVAGQDLGKVLIRTHWEFKEPLVVPTSSGIDLSGSLVQ